MRLVVIARASALIGFAALLSACPKKEADVVPEPAATTTPAPPAEANDKAGAEAPAPAATPAVAAPAATPAAAPAAAAPAVKPKKKDDQGGW